VKELVRRAVLRTLTEDSKGPISVTVDALMAEFETMQQAQNSITRTLLGGTAGS
jgi:hypothetical protein